MTTNKPVNSIADDLSGLRTDYHELMEQLQKRQRTLRSKFTQNVTTRSPKISRRSHQICMENPRAKRMKIVENEKTFASRSKQNIAPQSQKTSTPYKSTKHSRTTTRRNMPNCHKPDSSSLKRKHTGESLFSHLTTIENENFIIDDANRRPKKPYPTPLRVHNTPEMSFTQQQRRQTSTPKSIMKNKTTPVNTSASTSASLHKSEKENIVGLRRSTRLSRSPRFHSDALRLDYHNEMRKRRRLSDDALNNSYKKQLDHAGNNRPKPVQATDVTSRPKSILMHSRRSRRTPNRVNFRLHDTTSDQSHLDQSGRVQPLLGYDWIAGLLDAEDTISERSDAYFDELKDFRRVNKEDCVYRQTDESSLNKSSTMITGLPRATITHPSDTHQCLHNFTLNDRLFVVPVHSNQEGESTCPICHESRTAEVRRGSPSYIRVSIPRSTLRSPYKLRPHRRRSFDASDALGLSQHCLAGWENSRPSMLPMATNIDLKDALRPQILKEGTVGNESLYKSSKRLPLVPTERTQRLLNRSHSLRVQLNRMKNKHA